MQRVSVEPGQCLKTARKINSLDLNPSFYKREFLTFDADRETKLRVYLISAAICHQTHALHHPGLDLRGWDYMEYGMLQMLRSGRALLNPGYISICEPEEMEEQLRIAFSPEGNPATTSLDRLEERIRLLQEICSSVRKHYNNQVSNLIDRAKGKLLSKRDGLYALLSSYEAFSDPFRKKISFFIKLSMDAGVLHIKDPENIIPIMDYHMQRVLLRLGCVSISDPHLKDQLINRIPLGQDDEVRSACIDAIGLNASQSRFSVLTMNDIFWPLGRSCCEKTTLCHERNCLKSPCTLTRTIDLNSHSKCIFQEFCPASRDESYRNLWEPQVRTHYY